MSLLFGSSTANPRATKQYYKFGNPHTNMKDSNSRSMNLQQILRKSVSRLETEGCDGSSDELQVMQMLTRLVYECVTQDKLGILPIWITLLKVKCFFCFCTQFINAYEGARLCLSIWIFPQTAEWISVKFGVGGDLQ